MVLRRLPEIPRPYNRPVHRSGRKAILPSHILNGRKGVKIMEGFDFTHEAKIAMQRANARLAEGNGKEALIEVSYMQACALASIATSLEQLADALVHQFQSKEGEE